MKCIIISEVYRASASSICVYGSTIACWLIQEGSVPMALAALDYFPLIASKAGRHITLAKLGGGAKELWII